ncbi:MAG: acetyl-CoA carboxylase biotin carboxyl carrier protein [Planctomycetota bacterium]|jgi:acetyl-CoA carboxylase biotin carboxyl carrier protein|nr:acetyl-CoA carboxylase biotin carboxyl carrier protein [Planctomycetota bacterium]
MSDSIEKIKALLDLMRENDVIGLKLTEGDFSVAIRKPGAGVVSAPAVPPVAVPAAPKPETGARTDGEAGLEPIPSPIVGTFYRGPSPDAPPYVSEGDRIRKDSVVCIIEAMKIMNEIKAGLDGNIKRVLVESGEPVEYGQPLFIVRRG